VIGCLLGVSQTDLTPNFHAIMIATYLSHSQQIAAFLERKGAMN
jgi:hypothetical protein